MQALEDLDYLAALDNDGNLSEFGIIMSEFPLDPQLSKSILASCEFECVDEMLTIAAMVTGTPNSRLAAWLLPPPNPHRLFPRLFTEATQRQTCVIHIPLFHLNEYLWPFKSRL